MLLPLVSDANSSGIIGGTLIAPSNVKLVAVSTRGIIFDDKTATLSKMML